MTVALDSTHDPARESWIPSANVPDADFPIQNLPYGVFRRRGSGDGARIGVAIGERVLDLAGCVEAKLLDDAGGDVGCALSADSLNDLAAHGPDAWQRARHAIANLLDAGNARLRDDADLQKRLLLTTGEIDLLVPARIGDYTDFYCSIHHATNVGSMFRPDNPLMPNYKHLPVGYHGRASSIVASGTPVRRPHGQTIAANADAPTFGPSRLLDYELEMGFFAGGVNELGHRIEMADAGKHIFGMCVVNDWSARDVQKWEYQPLGPFNAKNFCTTIGPWIVTMDALAPYRLPGGGAAERGPDSPPLLDYLVPVDDFGVSIELEVYIASAKMREQGTAPHRISRGNFRHMYWTIAQMLVHHASTGCNISAGDLIASGTVSGPTEEERGCLLERTWRGEHPIELPDGTSRKFLQDGDELSIRAWCEKNGAKRIGFGECTGVVFPAD